MAENKEKKKPHFVAEINYAPNQDWRTDFNFGQRGSTSHGHMAASGATIWYLRDEQGKEIIVDGKVITNTSQSQSNYKQDTSKEAQYPEKHHSENEDS
jgi:hypothetical protein